MTAVMPTYGRLPVAFVRGEAAWLYDQNDRRYLDGMSGIAVTNLGHAHPAVTRAICEQAPALLHTSNYFGIPAQEQLAAQLTAATGMTHAFFCNSGAEANETAIKLARALGHRRGFQIPTIIVLEGAFHGRTLGALSATGKARIKTPFEPLLQGFVRVPRGDLEALHSVADDHAEVVAVMLEPVQGEGGVWDLDPDYLHAVRGLCDREGWLLMFDEVQSGNGRCGALYACQRLGVEPDVLATAKGLGNGVPIGALLARGEAAAVLGPGDHGTTFGGNPLACAVGSAVIGELCGGALWNRAEPLRAAVLAGLESQLRHPEIITDIRGLGLMIGIELSLDTAPLMQSMLDRGGLITLAGDNTVRLLPPLVMTDAEAGTLGAMLAEAIDHEVGKQEHAA